MSGTTAHNGQIPTDPNVALLLVLAIVCACGQLDGEQAQTVIAAGSIAELVLLLYRLHNLGR